MKGRKRKVLCFEKVTVSNLTGVQMDAARGGYGETENPEVCLISSKYCDSDNLSCGTRVTCY